MSKTIDIQLDHRTIREFEDRQVDEGTIDKLLDVVNRTATSMGMQSFSLIRVRDRALREEFAEITGQDYISRVPELFIFVVDQFRNKNIGLGRGEEVVGTENMYSFFQGFTDGVLAAQNLTVAIESLGMGAVYFGSILNDVDRVIKILNLPKLTFPILGVGFGYPNQEPEKKPRMDMSIKAFDDGYKVYEDYGKLIEGYDKDMGNYYDLRDANTRVDSFTEQVLKKYASHDRDRANILEIVKKQGFKLKV